MDQTQLEQKTVTILDAASLSAAVDLKELTPVALIVPAVLEDTNLTFQGSYDGTNFYNLYDFNGNEIIATVVTNAARFIPLDPAKFWGIKQIKIRQGTSASAVVASGADRVFELVVRNL